MYVDPSTYQKVDEAVEDFATEIPLKSINLTEEIGNGEFGNVYRGVWKTSKKDQVLIAVKTLKVIHRVCFMLCVANGYYLPPSWTVCCNYVGVST